MSLLGGAPLEETQRGEATGGLAQLRGFRREVVARTCSRLRRETRLQLQAMRRLLHALFDQRSARC